MKAQQIFRACMEALVNPDLDWPVATSLVGKQIVLEFVGLHRSMPPKHWEAEVHAIAEDYELDSTKFHDIWESGTPISLFVIPSLLFIAVRLAYALLETAKS